MNKSALSQIKTFLLIGLGAVTLVTVFQNCAPSKHSPEDGVPTALTPKLHDNDPNVMGAAAGEWKVAKFEGSFCMEKSKATGSGTVCAMVISEIVPTGFSLSVGADGEIRGATACHSFTAEAAAWPAKTAEVPPSERDAQNLLVGEFSIAEKGSCADAAKTESSNLLLALGNARFFVAPATNEWTILTSSGGRFSLGK